MRLAAHQQSLFDELMHLDDAQERLAAAVDRARRAPRLAAHERHPGNRVPGCSSTVWLIGEFRNGRCYFRSDADSPVVRGLVGLLAEFYSDAQPAEIIGTGINIIESLKLHEMLTPTRQHGLAAVRAAIRAFAVARLNPAPSDSTGADASAATPVAVPRPTGEPA